MANTGVVTADVPDPADAAPWVPAHLGGVGAVVAWRGGDGTDRVASSGTDGVVRVWNGHVDREMTLRGSGQTGSIQLCLTVSQTSHGVRLASGGGDGKVRVWDPETGQETCPPMVGHTGWIHDVSAWTAADGSTRLASASSDGTVRVWDAESGQTVVGPLIGHDRAVHAVCSWTTSDGRTRIVSAGHDAVLCIWDAETGSLLRQIGRGHSGGIWSLTAWITPDGDVRVASGSADGTVRICDPDTGAVLHHGSTGQPSWIYRMVSWVDDSGRRLLASASMDRALHLWDPDAGVGEAFTPRAIGSDSQFALFLDAGGHLRLAGIGADRSVHLVDAQTTLSPTGPIAAHTAGLWALATWTAPDGRTHLAAAGDGGEIRLWDADSGATLGSPLVAHTATVWALSTYPGPDGSVMMASAGDDGSVCHWNLTKAAMAGPAVAAHAGWIPSLATWVSAGGEARIASGGADGAIRVWAPGRVDPVASLDTAAVGCEWVFALASWPAPDGTARLAFAGDTGDVRVWAPDDGTLSNAFAGHTSWIRALVSWTTVGGQRRLAAGAVDGTILIWDVDTAAVVAGPIAAHEGIVRSLAVWTDADGLLRLVSGGADDGTIRQWDADCAAPIGAPLTGHARGVWTLAVWVNARGRTLLASTGPDGTIRLWDPQAGTPVRTIEVGPITLWGLPDTPSRHDVLGRQALADAIADQLHRPDGSARGAQSAPMVVSVEGPWGSGKSTLMDLVRRNLVARHPLSRDMPRRSRPMTVRQALSQIRRYRPGDSESATVSPVPRSRGLVTAWFNPWAHQSGEQVWAGLAHEILEAAGDVLHPSESERQRYWFGRNLVRVDRYSLRRTLHRRARSPMLGIGLAAIVIPFCVALATLNIRLSIFGHTFAAVAVAIGVAAAFLLVGLLHTAVRQMWGAAAHYLPAPLLHGPVNDDLGGDDTALNADALRRARAGALYLHQHDVADVIKDLSDAGHDLVVFIDDIDRCRAGTVVEVFEAVNLFLSSVVSHDGLRAQFVIGLDPDVVVTHLDQVYANPERPYAAYGSDDPTPGWAFLRKIVQLPVIIPRVHTDGVQRFVDEITGPVVQPESRPFVSAAPVVRPNQPRDAGGAPAGRPRTDRTVTGTRTLAAGQVGAPATVATIPWQTMEQHPRIRALLVDRVAAPIEPSIREAKRLINVWQLYLRLCDAIERVQDPTAAVDRARGLVIVAEIVTRWPALQRQLHRRVEGQTMLQLLAAGANEDDAWNKAAAMLGAQGLHYEYALEQLRMLMRDYDGPNVARLAALIL